MWLSDRRAFLTLLAGMPLAGCGFAPIHGAGRRARALEGRVELPVPENEFELRLVNRLQQRFGATLQLDYRLRLVTEVTVDDLELTGGSDVTRSRVTVTADFVLEDAQGGVVLRDRVHRSNAYTTSTSPYATRVAEREARDRLAVALADRIFARLAARIQDLDR